MADARPATTVETASAALLADFMHGWNNSDAHLLAELFATDADLITPDGIVSRGRSEIEGFYAAVFARGYKGSHGEGEIVTVRLLSPDIAFVDATWSIADARNPDGSNRPPQKGILASVMGMRNGKWRILALRENAGAVAVVSAAGLATH